MPITRSYTNGFEVTDYTQELALVPQKWSLLNDVGLFVPESVSTNTVTFEEQNQTLALLTDQYRGSKPRANSDDTRKIHAYSLAHFPVVDAVKPEDLSGKRAYGSQDAAETEAAVIARKVARIARAMDDTLELARFRTLSTLQAWAPNGTISANFASDFGITQKSVNFVLGTAGTDVVGKVEEVIAHIQDNAQGTTVSGVVFYCSPEWFSALISHSKIQAAYTYYSATEGQMIQRNRAGGNNMSLYRQFSYAGATFIEVRGSIGGTKLVPTGEAIAIPTGTDGVFMTYFGPANKLDLVNTLGEQRYMWTYRDPKGEGIDIQGELNFLNIVRQPALVVRATNT
jgi:Phage major capsid protein E